MSAEEKLAELERQKQQAQEDFDNAAEKESAKRYEAAQRILEVEEKIRKQREEIAAAEKKAQEEIAEAQREKQKAIEDAQAALREEEDRQALEAMTPQKRAEELRKRQRKLYDEARAAAEGGDAQRAAELKLEGLRMNDAIEQADHEARPSPQTESQRPNIVAGGLASIGGGGGVFISGYDPQVSELRMQTSLLQQLVQLQRQQRSDPATSYQL